MTSATTKLLAFPCSSSGVCTALRIEQSKVGSFFPFDSFDRERENPSSRIRIRIPNYVKHGNRIPAKIAVDGKAILQYVRMRSNVANKYFPCNGDKYIGWIHFHTVNARHHNRWKVAECSTVYALYYENRHQNKGRIMVIIGLKLPQTVCLCMDS